MSSVGSSASTWRASEKEREREIFLAGEVGLRVDFMNINDMYNNDGGQGGVWVCEAHEVGFS